MSESELNKNVIIEQKSFYGSDFMRALHTVPKGEEMDVTILSQIQPVPWMSYQKAIIPQTPRNDKSDGPDQSVYNPSHEMDYLFHCFLATETPRITVDERVRDQIRIGWPRNLYHHIIISGEVLFGTKSGPKIPNGWLDHQMAWFMKAGPGQEANYNRSIGNIRSLIEWNTILPAKPLRCPQPFWFSESMIHAVPLFLCKKTQMSIRYSYNLQILRLLRMQKLSNGKWIDIVKIEEKAMFLDNNIDSTTKFRTPTMIGRYGTMDSSERDYKSSISQSVLATSIIKKMTTNTVESGRSATIQLNAATPIYSIYFSALHTKAIRVGDLSNYTTNPHNRYEGCDPILSVKHYYSGNKFNTQDQSDFGQMEPWYHALSSPREPGYGMYSVGRHPYSLRPDVGLMYDKDLAGSMEFQMDSTGSNGSRNQLNIGKNNIEELLKIAGNDNTKRTNNDKNDKYLISVYLLTRFIIKYRHGFDVYIGDGSEEIEEHNNSS